MTSAGLAAVISVAARRHRRRTATSWQPTRHSPTIPRAGSSGAGQNLAKPFHFAELALRIRALARRQPAARARTTISRLRRKLGDRPVIATIPGTGYRIAGPCP